MVIQGVTYLSDFEAKKAIIEAARRMEAKGFLVAGDGSLSGSARLRCGSPFPGPIRPPSPRICWFAWT